MPATESYLRDIKKVHVVFAASAFALLATTFWMMSADHRDEWRSYQVTFDEITVAKDRARISAITAENSGDVEKLRAEVEAAKKDVATRQGEVNAAKKKLDTATFKADQMGQEVRNRRAFRDKARADYDLAVSTNSKQSQIDRLLRLFNEQEEQVQKLESEWAKLQVAQDAVQKEYDNLTKVRTEAEKRLKDKTAEVDLIHKQVERTDPDSWLSSVKRRIMLMPIVDGFNSPHKIKQVWLPDVKITLGQAKTARFDRCQTCHLGIDMVEPGDKPAFPAGEPKGKKPADWVREGAYPQPFSTHPRTDLYLTAASPHPIGKFGCTICHDGNGSGTSFQNAEHTPQHPIQGEKWAHDYHHHANHYWEYPMQPHRFIESSCIKCHHNVEELGSHPKFGASAPKAFQGYRLIQKYGCFGCHEVNGFDGARPIGPQLLLEPNYVGAGLQVLHDPALRGSGANGAAQQLTGPLAELQTLARQIVNTPDESGSARARLIQLLAADRKSSKPQLRQETLNLADLFKDVENGGTERKIGPTLRHLAVKTTRQWTEYWTEEPKRFRPDTKMPQFFNLTNQHDEIAKKLQPVEISGIAQYLLDKSQSLSLLAPAKDYKPDAARGKSLFSQRGCVACHKHGDVAGGVSDFGPELSRVHQKILLDKKASPSDPNFSNWLYTWIRDPKRYNPPTKMPNVYLEPYTENGKTIDPAADIAAFLLEQRKTEKLPEIDQYPVRVGDETLDELVRLYLKKSKVLGDDSQVDSAMSSGDFPIGRDLLRGDEVELARGAGEPVPDKQEWRRKKLNYIGRKTMTQYGCFGCHDIPGYEGSRPIGTALQDWGRKDTSRLAFEHITEFLHHHGEPDGSSTTARVKDAAKRAIQKQFSSDAVRDRELSATYFYESIEHHGRPGFIWQKLRDPRSYDYKKIETKGYDERLRMPKFPLDEKEIEAISTFVLGLVADPPASQYLYRPTGPTKDRIQGEHLLHKYNCASCHVLDFPKITYSADPKRLPFHKAGDDPLGFDLLQKLKPAREAVVGPGKKSGEVALSFRGLEVIPPDLEEDPADRAFTYSSWENLTVNGQLIRPMANHSVPVPSVISVEEGRGGDFARWLVGVLSKGSRDQATIERSWQASPPPLYQEGIKVQTPWLYQFLKNPGRVRHTTVLRMPRFDMSDAEAKTLANYFAAVDGAPYPYQQVPEREPDYLTLKDVQFPAKPGQAHSDYLSESWKLLNNPGLCIKCHSVGGKQVQISDPKTDIRGPNLDLTVDRLRPEWTMLWIYNPKWITPYTSMPAVFDRNRKQFTGSFEGDGDRQAQAVRDALMNYHRLMEQHRNTTFQYSDGAAPAAGNPQGANAPRPAAPAGGAGGGGNTANPVTAPKPQEAAKTK